MREHDNERGDYITNNSGKGEGRNRNLPCVASRPSLSQTHSKGIQRVYKREVFPGQRKSSNHQMGEERGEEKG